MKDILNKGINYNFFCLINKNSYEKPSIIAGWADKKVKHFPSLYSNNFYFGHISYDYKNSIEEKLTKYNKTKKNDSVYPDYAFFIPEKFIIKNLANTILESSFLKTKAKILCSTSKKDYIETVKTLKKHLQKGDIYEINYCIEFFIENINIEPVDLYLLLNKISPMPFSCFYKYYDNYLLSASPERFIKKTGNKIISQPIKGTAKRNKKLDEFKNNNKDIAENVMTVDVVRNDLSKIAKVSTVNVEELCSVRALPGIYQMYSTISCEINNNIDFKNIIHATFPMASMTGAPKIRAMQLIDLYEKKRRNIYSGTVGYITKEGNFDFNVIIRSVVYNKKTGYLSFMVGSAITIYSDPEKEYNECLLKANALFKIFDSYNIYSSRSK